MDDAADVAAVDAHAERDGRDDDVDAFVDEVVLHFGAFARVKTRVVRGCFDFERREVCGERFGVFAADAIDDAALIVVLAEDAGDLCHEVRALHDSVGQIGAIECADKYASVFQAKLVDDVLADAGCCGCSESMEGNAREDVAEFGEAAVFGTEVVAPLTDAVGFVDGEGFELACVGDAGEPREERRLQESFRRDVEQTHCACADLRAKGAGVFGRNATVQASGGVAVELKTIDLVFHQGDER